MSDSPVVSVLMSVYGGKQYLGQAIQSVLDQTFKDFEFIIIDDGSRDESLKMIRSFQDPRIVLIENKVNQGLTKSLNVGIAKAKGKYIARMDADDISSANRLEKQVQFLEENQEIWAVGTGASLIDHEGKSISSIRMPTSRAQLKYLMTLGNNIIHPSVMMRTEMIRKIGGYSENCMVAQDYDLWIRILESGGQLANLEEELIKLRVHDNSVSQTKAQSQIQQAIQIQKRAIFLFLKIRVSNRELEALRKFYQNNDLDSLFDRVLLKIFRARMEMAINKSTTLDDEIKEILMRTIPKVKIFKD